MVSPYILHINSLAEICFVNNFSLLILLMVFFVVHKLCSFMQSHLFIFAFVAFVFGVNPKNYCQHQCQEAYYTFSSRNSVVSDLTFKSLILLGYGVRLRWSRFKILHVAV